MINDYDFVADIYDVYNTASYDIDFYVEKYKSFQGKAIELMAGTGRLSVPLLKSGINLDCLDISKGLLEHLSKKLTRENLNSTIICQDIRDLNLEHNYDLVIIAFNSFAEIVDENDQELVFESIKKILTPSGEFIFTLYNPVFRRKSINNNLALINELPLNDNKLLFFMSSKENEGNIVEIKQFYELYDRQGNFLNKRMLDLQFSLITKEKIEKLIKKTDLKVTEFYGNFDLSQYNEKDSPFMIYVLKK